MYFCSMIFYFSGTGNTRWVAQQIAEAIGEELVFIPDAIRQGRYEYTLKDRERIGFCFPTHGWQPPRIVREFIRHLQMANTTGQEYCWALTTCGDNMGKAMTILDKELAAKGLKTVAQFALIMPESYVCLPFMYTDPPEKEKQKIDKARDRMSHIISIISERKRDVAELVKGATPNLYSYVIGSYFNKRMVTDKKFMVDEGVCIRCGRCGKVCPVDNIEGTPPVWLHNGRCTSCLACYHYCPVHAINYGERTRKREQYFFKSEK